MENKPGTYALILRSGKAQIVDVGRIGQVSLQVGFYAYIGSAHGSGGLSARVSRHLSRNKKTHWHIDYLTAKLPVIAVWYISSPKRHEHEWAAFIAGMPGSEIAAKRLGSSDCGCITHLFYFRIEPDFLELRKKYGRAECLCV